MARKSKSTVETPVEEQAPVEQTPVEHYTICVYSGGKFSVRETASLQEAYRDLCVGPSDTIYFPFKDNIYAVRQAFPSTKVQRGATIKKLNDKSYYRVQVTHFLRQLVQAVIDGHVVDHRTPINIDPTTGEEYPF